MTIEQAVVESPMSKPSLLTAAKLSPLLVPQLEAAFGVHDRLHETDPAAFASVAPQVRAIALSSSRWAAITSASVSPTIQAVSASPSNHARLNSSSSETSLKSSWPQPASRCAYSASWLKRADELNAALACIPALMVPSTLSPKITKYRRDARVNVPRERKCAAMN